jgi:hypothetical protein
MLPLPALSSGTKMSGFSSAQFQTLTLARLQKKGPVAKEMLMTGVVMENVIVVMVTDKSGEIVTEITVLLHKLFVNLTIFSLTFSSMF